MRQRKQAKRERKREDKREQFFSDQRRISILPWLALSSSLQVIFRSSNVEELFRPRSHRRISSGFPRRSFGLRVDLRWACTCQYHCPSSKMKEDRFGLVLGKFYHHITKYGKAFQRLNFIHKRTIWSLLFAILHIYANVHLRIVRPIL